MNQVGRRTSGGAADSRTSGPAGTGIAVSWIVLAAITLAQATEAFTVQGFPALVPFVGDQLALTKIKTGLLTSAFFAGGFVSVLPAGWVIDRIGVRRSLVIGLGLMTGCVAAGALARTYWLLYVCLFVAGIGFGSVYPATTKAVMHWAPPRWRATMMGIKQTGVPVGGAVAAVVLPVVALRTSWRGGLLLAAVLCLACMVLCRLLYRPHPDETRATRDAGQGGPAAGRAGAAEGGALAAVLRSRDIWLVNLSGFFFLAAQGTMIAWLVSYLQSELALPIVAAGTGLAMVQMGGAAGRLGWGPLSDLLFGGRRVPIIALLGLVTAATLVSMSLLDEPDYWLVLVTCLAAGLGGLGWVGMVTVLRAELAPPRAIGTVTSLGSFMSYAGSLVGPPLFGALLDSTGDYRLGWRLLAVSALLAAGLVLPVSERNRSAGPGCVRHTSRAH